MIYVCARVIQDSKTHLLCDVQYLNRRFEVKTANYGKIDERVCVAEKNANVMYQRGSAVILFAYPNQKFHLIREIFNCDLRDFEKEVVSHQSWIVREAYKNLIVL